MWGETREDDNTNNNGQKRREKKLKAGKYERIAKLEKTIGPNDLGELSAQASLETILTTDMGMVDDRNGANRKIERLKRENDELLAENNLICRQLYLAKHNASLRVVNILTDILNWLDIQGTSSYGQWNVISTLSDTLLSAAGSPGVPGSPHVASPPERPTEDIGPPLHMRDLMSPNPSRRMGAGNSLSKEEREAFLVPSSPDRLGDYYETKSEVKETYTRSSTPVSEPGYKSYRRDRSLTPEPMSRTLTVTKKEKRKTRSKTPEPRMLSPAESTWKRKSRRSESPKIQIIPHGRRGVKSPRDESRAYTEDSRSRKECKSPRMDEARYIKEERYYKDDRGPRIEESRFQREERRSPRDGPITSSRESRLRKEEQKSPREELRSHREEKVRMEERRSPKEEMRSYHKDGRSQREYRAHKGESSRNGYKKEMRADIIGSRARGSPSPAAVERRGGSPPREGWRTPRLSRTQEQYSNREIPRRNADYEMQEFLDESPRFMDELPLGTSTREKFLTSRKVQDVYDDGLNRTFKVTYDSKGTEKDEDAASVSSREFTVTRTDYRTSPSGEAALLELDGITEREENEPVITTPGSPVKQLFPQKAQRDDFFAQQNPEFSSYFSSPERVDSPRRYESPDRRGSPGRADRESSPRRGDVPEPERRNMPGIDVTPDIESPPFARETPQTAVYNKALHNNKKVPSTKRLIGEVAFQLDRRILNYVFASGLNESSQDRRRFYGYIIQNIPDKIIRESIDRKTGDIDYQKRAALHYRYQYILKTLRPLGYDVDIHSELSVELVNKYGLLPLPSSRSPGEGIGPEAKDIIQDIIMQVAPIEEQADIIIMLECLALMARDDNKPMLMFT